MTEQQIELIVEKWFDRIDRQYMGNELSYQDYMAEVEAVRLWADAKYAEMTVLRLFPEDVIMKYIVREEKDDVQCRWMGQLRRVRS
jgi:hypothetical protein